MVSNDRNSQSQASRRSSKRVYWRRAERRAGWGLSGWLPLIGLLAVFGYGVLQTAPAIETATATEVRTSLTGFGLENFEVEANGQDVLVTAEGPQSLAAEIDAWAGSSGCDTWIAGEQICPLDVRVEMSGAALVAEEVESSARVQRFHNFSFSEADGVLTLSGEVPNEGTRQAILRTARQSYTTVNNNLQVSGEFPTDGFDWAVDRAWPTLNSVENGAITWLDGSFSVSGQVAGASVEDVRRSLATAAFSERLGDLSLSGPPPAPLADVCSARFADSLSRSMIQFRSGSADIAVSSAPLLEELAAIARDCPLSLNVEGHTDSSGVAAFNDYLSLERAQAVVAALAAAGIDSSRLSAQGFGANRPIGDNATAAGRALNRRIEIKAREALGGEQ